MALKSECFSYSYQLTKFINDCQISKDRIQAIIGDEGRIILFYWDKK